LCTELGTWVAFTSVNVGARDRFSVGGRATVSKIEPVELVDIVTVQSGGLDTKIVFVFNSHVPCGGGTKESTRQQRDGAIIDARSTALEAIGAQFERSGNVGIGDVKEINIVDGESTTNFNARLEITVGTAVDVRVSSERIRAKINVDGASNIAENDLSHGGSTSDRHASQLKLLNARFEIVRDIETIGFRGRRSGDDSRSLGEKFHVESGIANEA